MSSVRRGERVLVAVGRLGGFAGDGGELLKTHVGCVCLLQSMGCIQSGVDLSVAPQACAECMAEIGIVEIRHVNVVGRVSQMGELTQGVNSLPGHTGVISVNCVVLLC